MTDGGFAFPQAGGQRGLTLREYYLGPALIAVCSFSFVEKYEVDEIVAMAGALADAMVREANREVP